MLLQIVEFHSFFKAPFLYTNFYTHSNAYYIHTHTFYTHTNIDTDMDSGTPTSLSSSLPIPFEPALLSSSLLGHLFCWPLAS